MVQARNDDDNDEQTLCILGTGLDFTKPPEVHFKWQSATKFAIVMTHLTATFGEI